MEDICKELIESYNTNVLDRASPEVQRIFREQSERYKDSEKGRYVLMNLIYNHYNKKQLSLDGYIGGPISLTCHRSNKYNKTIYIFGENHSCPIACKDKDKKILFAHQYINKLIKNTDCFLDIYLESSVINNAKRESGFCSVQSDHFYFNMRSEALMALRAHLYECTNPFSRSVKKCQLSRIHYFDTRQNVSKGYNKRLTEMIVGGYSENPDFLSKKSNSYIITMILNLTTVENIKKMNKKYDPKSMLDHKEISKSYLSEEITDFIEGKIYKIMVDITENVKILRKNIMIGNVSKNKIKIRHIKTLIYYLLLLDALWTDAYTLSRIFKKFDLTKQSYDGEKTYNKRDQPEEPRNIIIYAGDFHATTYREFLEKMGFDTISNIKSTENNGSRCIDLKKDDIYQPFFPDPDLLYKKRSLF